MPPSGYLDATGIEACLVWLSNAYPSFTSLITLPEPSVEGRTSRALKIGTGGGTRRGALILGGTHAREIVNPDALVDFALKMCQSYNAGTDIVLGAKTWPASTISLLVEGHDTYIFPLVNPDGRAFVQNPSGDAWWRKNRRVNPGTSCRGVDINRNYDFLWSSTIGQTSASPCADTYHGPAPFSEPETRNVKWLLDSHPSIECFVDVHSYSELVLYPWGDDDNQTGDPSQNFLNPAWNGLRGVLGAGYAEYIPAADLDRYVDHGNDMRAAIAAVRGRSYTVEQGADLYTTCGTSGDYAYSRNFANGGLTKVWGYTLETGTSFQPEIGEGLQVMKEAQSGLLQFLVACMCPIVDSGVAAGLRAGSIKNLREFRDGTLAKSRSGRRLTSLLDRHALELLTLATRDDRRRDRGAKLLARFSELIDRDAEGKRAEVPARLVADTVRFIDGVDEASGELRDALAEVKAALEVLAGASLADGLAVLDERPTTGTGARRDRAKPVKKGSPPSKASAKKKSAKRPPRR